MSQVNAARPCALDKINVGIPGMLQDAGTGTGIETMRSLPIILVLLILSGPALAARPDLRKMTCHQAQNLVNQRGAVVATTGKYTYKRFVSHFRYCDYWERAASAWVKTRDNPKCRINYICEERLDDFRFGGRGRY